MKINGSSSERSRNWIIMHLQQTTMEADERNTSSVWTMHLKRWMSPYNNNKSRKKRKNIKWDEKS